MDPVTIGILIASIISAAGAGVNYYSQNKANKQNIAMQRETNKLNYNIFQETKQYNSPQNMVDMYRKAGINPITAYGGLNNSAKLTPVEMDSPKVQAPIMDLQSLVNTMGQGLNTFTSSKKTAEEIALLKTENLYKADELQAKIEQAISDAKVKDSQVWLNQQNVNYQQKKLELEGMTVAQDIELKKQQIQNLLAEEKNTHHKTKFQIIQNNLAGIQAKYADAKSMAELTKLNSENNRILQEIENMKRSGVHQDLVNALTGLQLNMQVQTFDTTKRLLESKLLNSQLSPYFQGANTVNDILGTVLKRPSVKNTTYNQGEVYNEFNPK